MRFYCAIVVCLLLIAFTPVAQSFALSAVMEKEKDSKIPFSVVPRRNRIDLMTPAEKAIYDAVGLVESMGAHVRLTDAVVLLGQARSAVADYVDEVEQASK